MSKEPNLDRFAIVLQDLAEASRSEEQAPLQPFAPVKSELEQKLLARSLTPVPAPQSWLQRLAAWLDSHVSRRIWLTLSLLPTAALLFLLPMGLRGLSGRLAGLGGSSALPQFAVTVGKTDSLRSPGGQAMLAPQPSLGSPQAEQTLRRGETFRLEVRAGQAAGPKLAVQVYVRRAGRLDLLSVQPEAQEDGRFLLELSAAQLPELSAEQEIVVVCGWSGQLPTLEELRQGKTPSRGEWQQYAYSLRLSD